MNCIFISPHFPPQYHHFCQQLKFAGANALGIGDAPYDELKPAVRDSLTEYYRVNRGIEQFHQHTGPPRQHGGQPVDLAGIEVLPRRHH